MTPVLQKYFPDLTATQQEQFAALEPLYREWNTRINVISRKDIANFAVHHLLHSLAIGAYIRFAPGTKVLDAGTGGGFPGIPLAILFPEAYFTLADSTGKKISVVHEIGKAIGLPNINPVSIRVEAISETFDFVTGRAVTNLSRFIGMVQPKIAGMRRNTCSNGIFYLGGGSIDPRVQKQFPGTIITAVNTFFTEPYFESKKLIYIPVL